MLNPSGAALPAAHTLDCRFGGLFDRLEPGAGGRQLAGDDLAGNGNTGRFGGFFIPGIAFFRQRDDYHYRTIYQPHVRGRQPGWDDFALADRAVL